MTKTMLLLFLSYLYLIHSHKLFLIGGGLASTGQIFEALGKASGKSINPNNCNQDWTKTTCPKIAVVTSAASSEQDGNNAYSKDSPNDPSYYTMFKQNGFTTKHVSAHIDNYKKAVNLSTAEGVHNLNILNQADIIFFNGGDQSRHARTWLLDDGTPSPMFSKIMSRYENNQVVFSGTSAGTMIMCSPTFGDGISFGHLYFSAKVGLAQKSTKDGGVNGSSLSDTRNGTKGLQYQDNGGKMPGFAAYSSSILFDTHFDARSRLARLIPDLRDMNKTVGIGVDENTAIYLKDNVGYVYGQNGVWIVNNKNAVYNTTEYFQVQNVELSILTSGDSIDLLGFLINSSKEYINSPQYNGNTTSSNIVSAYEMTRLATRLVDQDSNYNLGISKTPSGYTRDTPEFIFIFSKNNNSKGYRDEKGKYTVDKIEVSISFRKHDINSVQS